MTFPTGSPGGYQGQPQQGPGYGQPQQGPGYPAPVRAGSGLSLGITDMIALGVGLLGLLGVFVGFVSGGGGYSFYGSGSGWVPALLGVSGLLGLLVVLPGNKDVKWGGLIALVNIGAILPVLFSFWVPSGALGAGGIILMIFAILQLLAAIALYLFESGLLTLPAPRPAYPAYPAPGYGQPGGYGPPQQGPGGYGPPPPAAGPTTGPQSTQVFGSAQQPYGQQAAPPPSATPPASAPQSQPPSTPPSGFSGGSPQ